MGPKVIHLYDVGMRQPRQRQGFALKALHHGVMQIGGDGILADDLQGHLALQPGIEGLVDLCHTAMAQSFNHVITSNILAGQVCHYVPPNARYMGLLYMDYRRGHGG
jgi:hypothetical protein